MKKNRTSGLNQWNHCRSTMYSVERFWVDILKQSYHFLTKSKARQHSTTLTTRGGGKWWAEMRGRAEVWGGARVRGTYDMCMCANLYKYHNKSMILQRLLSSKGSGRWPLVLGTGLGSVGVVGIFRVIGVKWGWKHFSLQFSHCPTSL